MTEPVKTPATNAPATDTSAPPVQPAKSPELEPLISGEKPPEPSPLDAPPEPEKPKPADPKVEEVKYELKAPEGLDTTELVAFAKEHKISPKAAQGMLDREMKLAQDLVAYQKSAREEEIKKGIKEIYDDPVLGKENLAKTKATVNNVWMTLPEDLRKELTDLGYHNDKRLVRILHHVGQGMKEARFDKAGSDVPATPHPMASLEAAYAAIHKPA